MTTDGTAIYNHGGGAIPTQLGIDNGLMLQGTSVGLGSDGAAFGNIDLGTTSSLTLTYSALPSNFTKFGAFSLGKVVAAVPEPASAGLMLIGLMSLLGLARKPRR